MVKREELLVLCESLKTTCCTLHSHWQGFQCLGQYRHDLAHYFFSTPMWPSCTTWSAALTMTWGTTSHSPVKIRPSVTCNSSRTFQKGLTIAEICRPSFFCKLLNGTSDLAAYLNSAFLESDFAVRMWPAKFHFFWVMIFNDIHVGLWECISNMHVLASI